MRPSSYFFGNLSSGTMSDLRETKKKKKKTTSTEDPQVHQQVGKYRLGLLIGQGASGKVYKAIDTSTATFVALKQIPLSNVQEIEAIRSEIRLLQSLKHPNIVKYLDNVVTKDTLNIVTEFVENGSLCSVIKKFGNLQESLIQIYVLQVC